MEIDTRDRTLPGRVKQEAVFPCFFFSGLTAFLHLVVTSQLAECGLEVPLVTPALVIAVVLALLGSWCTDVRPRWVAAGMLLGIGALTAIATG